MSDAVPPCEADSAPGSSSDARQLRTALDGIVSESLRPVALGLSLLFLVLAVSHALLLPATAKATMTAMAASTAALLLGLHLALSRLTLPPDLAHPVAAGAALLVLANCLLHRACPPATTRLRNRFDRQAHLAHFQG